MSAVELATAYVSLVPSATGIGAAIEKELGGPLEDAAKKQGKTVSDGFAAGFEGVGKGLSKTLTPAAAGLGLIFKQSFQEWDTGVDAIIAGTGKSGKALDGLTDSMKHVGDKVTQPLGQVGTAISELNVRLGLTGPGLETMATKMLDLTRLSGGDLSTNIANVTRVFGDWSIGTDDQVGALDKLYAATKQSGIGLDRLTTLTVQYGAPLRQLGFSFDETISLFGKFEKEGVNTETVFAGLRMGLARMSTGSEEANDNLATLQDTFDTATSKVGDYQSKLIDAKKALDLALKPPSANDLEGAQLAIERALLGTADAAQDAKAAQAELDKLRKGSDPTAIAEADRDAQRAKLAEADATAQVTAAQAELDKLRATAGTSAADIAEADRALTKAKLDQADAIAAAASAQKTLDTLRQGPTAADLAEAEEKVTKATLGQRDADLSLSETKKSLEDLKKQGTSQDEKVIEARKRVTDATTDLSKAQSDAAKAGKELAFAQDLANTAAGDIPSKFRAALEAIKNAGSQSEATALAAQIFGKRAGPDMAAAIREGRFEIDDLVKGLDSAGGSIDDAAERTKDWSEDGLAHLRNRVEGTLGPFAQMGMAISGVAAGVGPAILGMSKLGPAFGAVGTAMSAVSSTLMANPWVLVAVAVIALAVVIYKNWDTIKETIGKAWDWVWDKTKGVWAGISGFFKDWWPLLLVIFTGGIALLPLLIIKNWDKITGFTGDMAGKVAGFFKRLPGDIAGAFDSAWDKAWSTVTGAFGGVRDFAFEQVTDVVHFYLGMPSRIGDAFLTAWSAAWEPISGAFTKVADFAGEKVGDVVGFYTGLPGRAASAFTAGWSTASSAIGGKFTEVKDFAADKLDDLVDLVRGMPSRIGSAARGMWDGIGDAFRAVINRVIGLWNSLDFTIGGGSYDPLGRYGPTVQVPSFTFDLPYIHPLAKGGIVTGPTLAMIGEGANDEAVVPLPHDWKPGDGPWGGNGPSEPGSYTLIVQLDGKTIARAVGKPLAREIKVTTGATTPAF